MWKDKMLSGRYFLVLCCGFAFLYSVWAKLITSETITGILMMVFTSYFNRPDRGGNGNGDNGDISR